MWNKGCSSPGSFAKLPDLAATPDGIAIDSGGNLILACPNYADPSLPGCLLKFDRNRKVSRWVDVPVSPDTGHAFPMGIAFCQTATCTTATTRAGQTQAPACVLKLAVWISSKPAWRQLPIASRHYERTEDGNAHTSRSEVHGGGAAWLLCMGSDSRGHPGVAHVLRG